MSNSRDLALWGPDPVGFFPAPKVPVFCYPYSITGVAVELHSREKRQEDLVMSMGSKIYGSYLRQSAAAGRKGTSKKSGRRITICPFTLEAVRNCSIRKHVPRVACRFSLEVCLAPR